MKKKRGSEKSWGHPDQDTNTTLHHRGDDRLVFQTIISFLATRGNSGFFSPIVLVLIGQIVMIWFKYVVRVYSSSCSCSPVDVEKDKSQRLKTDLWHSVKTLRICWLQTFQQFNLQEEQGAEERDGGRGRGRSQHLRGGEGDGGERERECITGYRLSLVTELMGFCLFPSPRCLLNRGLCIEKDH